MNLLFPFSEIRNGQKELINDIKNVLETKGTLIAHAPTGIGKTAAALTPAIEYALNNDKIVFFLTSKQSQHKIVIDTLRLIKEKNKDNISFSVVDVISKQAMCPKDIAREYYALFNDLCTHDQKTKRCRYFRGDKNITKHILGNIMHVEELKDFCDGNLICPHKAAIDAMSEANIIICDYNYLFTDILETVLEKTHKSIGDLILIIDEAHNLPDRLREYLSGELTLNLIEEAAKEINPVDKKLYLHLKDVGRFFDNFIRRMPRNTEKNINREDITAGVEQVLQESLGDNISYLEFVGALKDAGVELAEKKQYEEKKKSSIILVMEFLDNWNTMFPCSRVYENNITPTLSFRLLDPSVLSSSIISNAHATIMMSGTLYPVEMYADILGAKHSLLRQYESPFPSENKIVLVTKKLTTLYTKRNDSMYSNIAEKISKIHDAVKGNIAVFFPSYSLMDEIYKKFESHPDFEISDKTSDIIFEKKYMSKSAKDELYLKLKINSNKILMGVQAGSLSEGVDYRNNIIHAVLIVGLPLSPPTLEVKNLEDYYIKKFGKEKGTLYGYIYPAISKVIQAAGRGIRSENDVGAIILMDYRFNYPMYWKCLPPDYKIQFTDEPEKMCKEFFGKDIVLKALEDTKKKFIEEEELKQMKEEKHILAESKSESKSETEKQQIQETIPERAEEKTENNDNPGLNILGLVETIDFPASRSLLAGTLTGSKSKELINRNIDKSEYYGMLKGYTWKEVINIIDQIIYKGYLAVKQSETTNFPSPLLYITELGKNVLNNDEKIEVKLPIKIKDRTRVSEVSKNPELLNELKFWRKKVAKEENIPAYFIFHDTTLIEISNSLPSSISDLMKIRGFGKKRIEKYSDDVLKIVLAHKSGDKNLRIYISEFSENVKDDKKYSV